MKLKTTLKVNAPAKAAWRVLGERFGDLRWTSSVDESHLEGDGPVSQGSIRACVSSKSFGPFPPSIVRERLTHFDPSTMTLTYELLSGLPGFVRGARNTWQITATGDSTATVTSHAALELAWWASPLALVLPWAMKHDAASFFEELRVAVEADAMVPDERPGMWLTA